MRDIITALGCFFVGALVIYEAADYPRLRGVEMHPGHYPTNLAYLLLFIGAVILARHLISGSEKGVPDGVDRKRAVLLVLALVAYSATMEWLGYFVSTLLFVAVGVCLFHGSRKLALFIGVVSAAALTLIFRYLFSAPVPTGLLF